MFEIKSDSGVAAARIGALTGASNILEQMTGVSLDHSSTIGGNKAAHQAIERSIKSSSSLVEAVQAASKNVRQTAERFEAMDQRIAAAVDGGQ